MDGLREQLASIKNYDQFFEQCSLLRPLEEAGLFDALFPIAIDNQGDGSDVIAGYALIELEPKHTLSCSQLLHAISKSRWNVSNREIPFYLVSQFGKWALRQSIDDFLRQPGITDAQRQLIDTIWYWASGPSKKLAEHLVYWEWQDVIEGNPDA